MRDSKLNICQRIAGVMGKVDYLKKEKTVDTYKVVTHDQVTAEVRPHFIEFGIVIVPSLVSDNVALTGTLTGKGTPILRHEAIYDIRFVNIDDPADLVTVRVAAHANDHGDKAPGKSLSYATKGAILKALMIETGETDEGRIPEHGGDEGVTGIDEKQLADLLANMEAASTADDLREAIRKAFKIAKDAADFVAHAKIKAAGTKLTKKFQTTTTKESA